MSFKITITDNNNGEVLFNEENARVIIGSIVNKDKTAVLAHIAGNGNDVMNAIFGVDGAKDAVFKDQPTAKLLYGLKALLPDED